MRAELRLNHGAYRAGGDIVQARSQDDVGSAVAVGLDLQAVDIPRRDCVGSRSQRLPRVQDGVITCATVGPHTNFQPPAWPAKDTRAELQRDSKQAVGDARGAVRQRARDEIVAVTAVVNRKAQIVNPCRWAGPITQPTLVSESRALGVESEE